MADHDVIQREAGARIAGWLLAIDRVSRRGFTAVDAAELSPEVRAESIYWCDEILSPEANPHDAPGARHALHRATKSAPDLLRHEYTAQGLGLTLIEGRNFLLILVDRKSADILALSPALRPAAVHHVADALFGGRAGRRGPSFALPEPIVEGACFCTDERAEPLLLGAWTDRVEGGIRGGRLYFLAYKKAAQRVGFAAEERWFADAARRGRHGPGASTVRRRTAGQTKRRR